MSKKNLKAEDVRKGPEKINLSEKEFFKIFDNSTNGIIIINAQNEKIEDANQVFVGMLGRAKSEFVGKKLWEIGAFIDFRKAKEIIQKTKNSRHCHYDDVSIKTGKGIISAELAGHLHGIDHKKIIQLNICDITRKKINEELVRRSEEKFREIFNDSPELIIVLDKKGVAIEANKLVNSWLKYKRKDIIGKNIFKLDFLTPESKKIVKDKIKKRFSNRSIVPYELEFINKQGQIRTAIISGNLMKGERDGEWRDLVFVNDITERKEAEKMLRESEEKFKSIFNSSTDGIVLVVGKNRKFITGNSAFCRMLGYSAKEITSIGVENIHPKKDLSYVIGEFNKLMEGKIKMTTGIPVKRKDGSIFYADITAAPVSFGGKKYLMGVLRDITERKKIEEMILMEKAKDDAILAGLGEGLIIVGKDEKIQYANEAAKAMLGVENDMKGKSFYDAVEAVDEKGVSFKKSARPLGIAMQTGKKVFSKLSDRLYYKRTDERTFPVSITISPIMIKGRIIGFVNVFRDITKEKEIDKVKSEFVSLASHQLRTPITSIKWNTEMLINGDAGIVNEKQKEILKEICDSNKRMVGLVDALLNVSRLELGTFIVEPEMIDFPGVVRNNLQEMELMIKANRIEISEKYDPRAKSLMADPKLLDIVVQNLLSNAIKYTKGGKVEISVERSDGHVIFKVSDSGIGIPKAQQNKIYSKLFRADNAKAQSAEGTGLGLYIVRLILEASGGRVWFKSEEGKGSSFYVSLPASGMRRKEGLKRLI